MSTLSPKRIGIAVVEHAGCYLIGTRGPDGPLPGYAEFPGGKCLPEELPEDCAVRECREETHLAITVERLLLRREHTYPHATVDLHFFLCHPTLDAAIQEEHHGFRWVPANKLTQLNFPEANARVLEMLCEKSGARRWSTEMICLVPDSLNSARIAENVYARVCRNDFSMPGFCVINVGASIDSVVFRRLMVDIKYEMAAIHERLAGNTLIYLSAGRFDQQSSTKPHLDGGPDESMLMLGYEPSGINAELEISDYTRCAFDLGIAPKEFMERHNPMFHSGFELLRPYAHPLRCFDPTVFQIVAINNSSTPIDGKSWLGTLHTATILNPDESKRRVINSTMIAPARIGTPDVITAVELHDFMTTSLVRRRGYDKTHLEDDT